MVWTFLPIFALAAQQAAIPRGPRIEPLPSAPRDAGTYHLATGTWSRSGGEAALGPKVLQNSNSNSGFFGVMGVSCDLVWTDEGRIPSTSGHPNAKSDLYRVDGFQLAYCSSVGPVGQLAAVDYYACYRGCSDPLVLNHLAHVDLSLPGSPSFDSTACWIVTIDIAGTPHEFEIAGDRDGAFDGTTALDNFGWTITMRDQGTGGFNGPLIIDCPNNWPYGDGTYFQNTGLPGTGLGSQDQFWLTDGTCYANGCYWFGHGCGSWDGSYRSFWRVLYGDNVTSLGERYSASLPNSTGSPAVILASGSSSAAAADLGLVSEPVPDMPGIFFHGSQRTQASFGNGYKCTQADLARGAIVVAGGNLASYLYDRSDPKHDLAPFVGQTRHFQHWFRDPAGGGALFNLSDALAIRISP